MAVVPEFNSEAERLEAIRRLIDIFEQQVDEDFTFDMKARARIRRYRRWLKELEQT